MAVNIQVTAQTDQATQQLQQFASTSAAAFSQTTQAAQKLTTASSAITTSAVTLNRNMAATRASLSALGRTATLLGGTVLPQFTANISLGVAAISQLNHAARAADLSLAAMAGRMALVAGAAASGFGLGRLLGGVSVGGKTLDEYMQEFYGRLGVGGKPDTANLAQQNAATAQRILEAAKLRADAAQIENRVALAQGLGDPAQTADALNRIAREVVADQPTLADYKALRQERETDMEFERATTDHLTAKAKERVQLEMSLANLGAEIKKLEENRTDNGLALSLDLITRNEFREKEAEDLRRIAELEAKRLEIRKQLAAFSYSKTVALGIEQMSEEFGNVRGNAATVTLNAIQLGVQGVSDSIMGAIDGTRTWGQVFLQVGKQIIASIIQIVVQWIVNMTLLAALKRILGIQDNAQAAASAAAWAPAAVAASIASFGAAAAIGGAAAITAMSAGAVAGSALSLGAGIPGREFGGPVTAGQPYIVGERRPELFVPSQSGVILPEVPGLGGRQMQLNVLMDREAWLDASRERISAIAVDAMSRERHRFTA